MKFDVEFTINRFSLKLQHRAVDLATKHELKDVLFPSGAAVTDRPMPQLRSGSNMHKQTTIYNIKKHMDVVLCTNTQS